MGKKSGSKSGMNNQDHSLKTILGLKYLNSLMRIRDGKIRIRDKHPRSATLLKAEKFIQNAFSLGLG
jgi:hypothetical protein